MARNILGLAPNLTARFIQGDYPPVGKWHFHGWNENEEFWCSVPLEELEELEKVARGDRGTFSPPLDQQTEALLVAISTDLTVQVKYLDLVTTVFDFCGWYSEHVFDFALSLETVAILVKLGKDEMRKSAPPSAYAADNLPF